MTYRKKLIALPLDAINKASAREKSIRHAHPSTLHLWWARRPLAACRAVLFASPVDDPDDDPMFAGDTDRSEQMAMDAVMAAERRLSFEPRDVSAENCVYDVESGVSGTGRLRFIEVKGRVAGAKTVTITKNEIMTGLNKPDDFILAIGLVDGDGLELRYVRKPFGREPDFNATSVNYDLDKLLERSTEPS